ncbi:hypothetical protein DPMN_053097 [Dreissena polymorpha]|uniref:Uncharacterized protein n=1 Tax=Dreissena polymorpha TaxID=45954 RepID=A0A9D4CKR5_DREPO|nr:hypothetical protein DPMN_190886 [Dreissena polymorpha]KAH3727170.1 hypothetical protein DPMN_053097 [Dreissena polymorpha]
MDISREILEMQPEWNVGMARVLLNRKDTCSLQKLMEPSCESSIHKTEEEQKRVEMTS